MSENTVSNQVLEKINEYMNSNKKDNYVFAIDGMCGSGKTTIASFLEEKLKARIIHADDFFLPLELRTDERYNEPGGNIHYERMKSEVIEHLNEDIVYQKFNCKLKKLDGSVSLPTNKITIVEGSYCLNPYFGDYYDMAIFLQVESETQLKRIKNRVPQNIYEMFLSKWIPLEKLYFENLNIKNKCKYTFKCD